MSKISYDALSVEGLKEVLIQVSETCKELEIGFFIVGAIARNIWFVSNSENPRGTKDIDFGIYVPVGKKYNELRKALQTKYKYTVSSENAFCLLTIDGKQIDLLPFGEIENEGQIMIEGKGLIPIDLVGYKEVYDLGVINAIIGNETYKTCSIPGIMILKLIAFDDRPDRRTKDIEDINSICEYYPNIETELIWGEHSDLYSNDLEHLTIGLIVLGREMKKLVALNSKLDERIVAILDKALKQETSFLSLMITNSETETIEMKANIVGNIKRGFVE